MFILNRRNFISLAAAGAAATAFAGRFAHAASTGTEVFTSDEAGLLVDSTVILGEKSAVVVDAQFTQANAAALADLIAATGRKVETILITHFHPDHILGLAVLMDRFPDAKPVAHAAVQGMIAQTAQPMLDRIGGGAPAGVFASRVVIPDVLSADHIKLEGERIEVLGPLHGDTALITPLHIPALKTVIAADIAYADTHLWLEENTKPEQIAAWRESIKTLQGLDAETIIPGHRKADSKSDASVFAQTSAYLDHWEKALAESKSEEELKAALLAGNEGLGFAFAIDRAVAAVYPPK